MAVRCAKPGCSHHAEAWFLLSRESCEVQLHGSPTDGATALCGMHLQRFTVPSGWSLHRVDAPAAQRPTPEPKTPGTRTERRPWFSSVSAPVERTMVSGGLLDRAFNGPSGADRADISVT